MGKSQKSYMSIKSKLMAAVAMLLVASFMVVSSTYAWFTLSTAPEVKGIKTTIGANGSLEIALAYGKTGDVFDKGDVTSKVGDSGDYTTWGNLVDASDEKYGMEKITLLPSRLNITTAEGIIGAAPLRTPLYGSDGRISALADQTTFGSYDVDNKQFLVDEAASGLVAIGTASGMTTQQSGYRNDKAAFDTNLSSAKLKASGSLNKYGSKLASTLVDYALGTKTEFDISAVANIIDELELAQGLLESAIRNYFGVVAAKGLESDDATYKIVVDLLKTVPLATLINGGEYTVDGVGTYTFAAVGTDVPVKVAYGKIVDIDTALKAANTAMTKDTEDTSDDIDLTKATKEEVRAILIDSGVIIYDEITVSGVSIDEIRTDEGKAALGQAAINGGVVVEMPVGSGVYSDIAEITGNYQSAVMIEYIEYNGLKLNDIHAAMTTDVDTTINVKGTMPSAPESASSANAAITDFYGYALDLVFRTNANNSNLMLQTTPTQRIYSDSTNQETQGSGSVMTFNPTSPDFTPEQMKDLMGAIRIVFTTKEVVTTGEGENETTTTTTKILAVAMLDVENATQTAEGGYTASIMLVNYELEADPANGDGETYQKIKLVETENADGTKTIFKGNDSTKDNNFAQKLMALNQNEATVLSAIVYLDGDDVDNADVAANAENSMTGSMSLQFSSDADLKPMMNTPLYNGTDTPAESN